MNKIIFTDEQIQQMIKMHDEGVLNREIAEYFHTSRATIDRRLAENNVQSRHPWITPEREQQVIDLYDKYKNRNEVVKQIGNIKHETITAILEKNNIKYTTNSELHQKYSINESYFEKIDSHRKAYYLGLLYADGCVSKRGNYVNISLQEEDKYIIEQFKKDLNSTHKIKPIYPPKEFSNRKIQYLLSIGNKKLHDDLIALGVLPQKSLILEFPTNLNEEYYCSFLLGYMDGDGHLSKSEKRLNFVSTESFCKSVAKIINDKFGIHSSIMYCHDKTKSTRTLSIAGGKQTKIFLDWIYSKCDVYLKRKYNIYKNNFCAA